MLYMQIKPWIVSRPNQIALLWFAVFVGVFFTVLANVVKIWRVNDTFNHCFLVLPIACYMIWQQRGAIVSAQPEISLVGGGAALCSVFIVVIGRAAHIDVLEHIGTFALLPAAVLFLFGWQLVHVLKFPLLFVLFSIPIGQEIIPELQSVTASIALYFLNLVSIPVFKDGLYIMVPNGSFVVAEACSGISFFIACIMIGAAYAYMNFISIWRAILFVMFSMALPILANGIRVFGIIYIANKTNMEVAVGADHLVYGGLFFSVMILVLLLVGYLISDGHRPWNNKIVTINSAWENYFNCKFVALALLPLLIAALFLKLLDFQVNRPVFTSVDNSLVWVESKEISGKNWAPQFQHADSYYVNQGETQGFNFYRAVYLGNNNGKELISWSNRLYDVDLWSLKQKFLYEADGLAKLTILDLTSSTGQRRLLTWWYTVPGLQTSNKYVAKLKQAVNALTLQPVGGAITAISLPYQGSVDESRESLELVLNSERALWHEGFSQ